jgi:hypothetical protein
VEGRIPVAFLSKNCTTQGGQLEGCACPPPCSEESQLCKRWTVLTVKTAVLPGAIAVVMAGMKVVGRKGIWLTVCNS